MSFKTFEDWRRCIQRGQLHSKPWLDMLRHVATKQAEKEEAAAQLANIIDYKQWVESGPAGGLRRQHQFTRNATGWTETALGKGNLNELGELDDLDGLSDEQLEAIKTKVGDSTSPADVQTEVNDQAASWKKVWGGDLKDKSDPTWPDDLGDIPRCSSSKPCSRRPIPSPWNPGLDGMLSTREHSTGCHTARFFGYVLSCIRPKRLVIGRRRQSSSSLPFSPRRTVVSEQLDYCPCSHGCG